MIVKVKTPSQCSIVLPIYNGKKFISKSIAVNLQTLKDTDELLIINDGSEDMTIYEIARFEGLDPRIRFINKKHSGLVDSLNIGVDEAEHGLIARADCDDSYPRNRISSQVDFLDNNPDISAVFSDYKMIDRKSHSLGVMPSPVFPVQTALSLINPQRTAHPSVVFRKSVFKELGGYKQSDFPAEDLGLWSRFIENHKIASLPQILLEYLRHPESVTFTRKTQVMQKTHDLRLTIAEQISSLIKTLEPSELVPNYSGLSLERKRTLLALRDLYTYTRITNSDTKKIFQDVVRESQVYDLKSISAATNLVKEKIRRSF
jgi:glycosyltransferase involved in cell wall biosynthesis